MCDIATYAATIDKIIRSWVGVWGKGIPSYVVRDFLVEKEILKVSTLFTIQSIGLSLVTDI